MLNAKQKAYCEEYVLCYNQTKSYQKVYGCSYDVANTKACRLMKDPEVKQYIAELQKAMAEAYGDLAELIIKELAEDIAQRDEKGKHNAGWQKSVDLLQKQLGLQQQNIKADLDTTIEVEIN